MAKAPVKAGKKKSFKKKEKRVVHSGVVHGSEFDIFADQALEHPLGIPGYGVQIERARPDDLFAAKGEQLAGEGGCMRRRASVSLTHAVTTRTRPS